MMQLLTPFNLNSKFEFGIAREFKADLKMQGALLSCKKFRCFFFFTEFKRGEVTFKLFVLVQLFTFIESLRKKKRNEKIVIL